MDSIPAFDDEWVGLYVIVHSFHFGPLRASIKAFCNTPTYPTPNPIAVVLALAQLQLTRNKSYFSLSITFHRHNVEQLRPYGNRSRRRANSVRRRSRVHQIACQTRRSARRFVPSALSSQLSLPLFFLQKLYDPHQHS